MESFGLKSASSELSVISGRLHILLPIIRCDGVNGSSMSSVEMYDIGLELRIASTSVIVVNNSSCVSTDCPKFYLLQTILH